MSCSSSAALCAMHMGPPRLQNGKDWRLLVEDLISKIAKLRGYEALSG